MPLIDRVLPDAQALAREGGETRPPLGCFVSIIASASIGIFGVFASVAVEMRHRIDISPVAIVAATVAALAWKVILDPSGRRRPVSSSLTMIGVAACIAWTTTQVLRFNEDPGEIIRSRAPERLAAYWMMSTICGAASLAVAKAIASARHLSALTVRVCSVLAACGLVGLAIAAASRLRQHFPDREAMYQAFPIVGTIPPMRDNQGFWRLVDGARDASELEGRISGVRIVGHRAARGEGLDTIELEVDAPKPINSNHAATVLFMAALMEAPVTVRRDLARRAWIFDCRGVRDAWVFQNGDWHDAPVFPSEWKVAPPVSFVVEGFLGLILALAIRFSPLRSRSLARARFRREILDPTLGPIVLFDPIDAAADDAGYRGAPHRPAPRLFHGTLAALDEALLAERAARDSLALAVAALAAAPLVGAAFAGVMW